MAEQRIAPGPRLSPIPIPQQRVSMLEGASDLIEAAQGADRLRRDTDERIAASEARIAERQRDADDDALYIDRAVALEEGKGKLSAELQTLRQANPGGGAVYHAKAGEAIRRWRDDFMATIGNNDRVRQRIWQTVGTVAARVDANEQAWSIEESSRLQGQQFLSMVSQQSNDIRTADGDPLQLYASARARALETLGNIRSMDESGKAKIRPQIEAQLLDGLRERMDASGRNAEMRTLLESGFFNDKIEDVGTELRKVENAERAATIVAQQREAAIRADAKKQLDTLSAQIDEGATPTDAEMRAARSAAQAAGVDGDDLARFDGRAAAVSINRQYSALPLESLYGVREQVRNNPPATPEGQMAAKQLDGLIVRREKETAARYKGLLGQGAAGRAQIVSELQRLPAEGRFSQAERIEPGLGYVAALREPATRAAVLNGREERKANPKLAPADQVSATFKATMGRAMLGISGAALNGVMNVTADLYTHAHRQAGGGEDFNPGLLRNSLNAVLGRTRRADGTPQGGLGSYGRDADGKEWQVALPDNKTQDEFSRDIARASYEGATYDGRTPFQKSDLGRRYFPVYLGENERGQARYRFVSAGGHELQRQGGGTFTLVFAR